MADGIPFTRNRVPPEREDAIRARVRGVAEVPGEPSPSRLAKTEDAAALLGFLSDPAVHAPIYSLPRPLTLENVTAFIEAAARRQSLGEGFLCVRQDEAGAIVSYSEFHVWPHWAAGEIGGALHPRLQSQGAGGRGALATFGWMFEALDLDLICETSALDNVRTARLLERIGFARMGETDSQRPDGSFRRSIVWEMTRGDWQVHSAQASQVS